MEQEKSQTLSNNLQLIEIQLNTSREDLAKNFGVSHQTISNWFAGRVRIEFLLWLEDVTGIPIRTLYREPLTPAAIKAFMNKQNLPNQNLFEPGEGYKKNEALQNILLALQSRIEILEKTHLLRAGKTEAIENEVATLKEEIERLKKLLKK